MEEFHQLRFVLLGSISIIAHNRNGLLELMVIISEVKLFLSLIVPVSFDIQDINMLLAVNI
jgi:hypothetical protein